MRVFGNLAVCDARRVTWLQAAGTGYAGAAYSRPCDGIVIDTDASVVFGQPALRPWIIRDGDAFRQPLLWSGANWTISGGKATHTAGSTAALTATVDTANPFAAGATYAVIMKLTGVGAGTATVTIGTAAGTARAATGVWIQALTHAGGATIATITPSSDFDGSVEIFKAIPATLTLNANGGMPHPRAFREIAGVAAASAKTTLLTTVAIEALWYGSAQQVNT